MNSKQTIFTTAALCCASLSAITLTLKAQTPAASAKNEMTMDERRQSITNLEHHIAEREERVTELRDDIRTLDTRVEKRVDRLVDILASSKDSNSSKITVVQTKQKTIEALRKTIKYYDEKRRAIRQMLEKKSAIQEDLVEDAKKIDARIEKRVTQIMELTKSFTPGEELEKYDETTNSSWGWSWTERRISDDWRQNRRDSNQTALEDKRVRESLKKSIEYLESRVVWLKGQLKQKDLSPESKSLFEDELSRNQSLVSIRQAQVDELDTPGSSGQPEPEAVSRDQAHDLARLLDDTGDDVRDDFYSIFTKYSELNQEREQVAKLQANLEARKKWMAEHASGDK
jgi:hypothetical protein